MPDSDRRVLLAHHSKEGQAAKVAERIADSLRGAGLTVEVHDAADAPEPSGFDAVVLGDSIHMGRHSRALRKYATAHSAAIAARPSALFQVSLTSAAHDEEHDQLANRYLADLLHESGIVPDAVGLFAGAIAYTRYGWIKTRVMRAIEESEGRVTDISTDVEYTDWGAVDHFAEDVAKLVVTDGRTG